VSAIFVRWTFDSRPGVCVLIYIVAHSRHCPGFSDVPIPRRSKTQHAAILRSLPSADFSSQPSIVFYNIPSISCRHSAGQRHSSSSTMTPIVVGPLTWLVFLPSPCIFVLDCLAARRSSDFVSIRGAILAKHAKFGLATRLAAERLRMLRGLSDGHGRNSLGTPARWSFFCFLAISSSNQFICFFCVIVRGAPRHS